MEKIKKFIAFKLSDVVFIMLINVKMQTIVGSLIFMSMIILCSAELNMKKFYNLRARHPDKSAYLKILLLISQPKNML